MDEFINSRTGRKFFDWTMPELVTQLVRLNENFEQLIDVIKELDKDEPIESVGDINKQIKENMDNIVNLRNERLKDD